MTRIEIIATAALGSALHRFPLKLRDAVTAAICHVDDLHQSGDITTNEMNAGTAFLAALYEKPVEADPADIEAGHRELEAARKEHNRLQVALGEALGEAQARHSALANREDRWEGEEYRDAINALEAAERAEHDAYHRVLDAKAALHDLGVADPDDI